MSDQDSGQEALIRRALKWSVVVIVGVVVLVILLVLLLSPDDKPDQITEKRVVTPEFQKELVTPQEFRFTEVSSEWGVNFVHENGAQGERLLPETMGGGVALFDFDQDDDLDLLFVNSNNWDEDVTDSNVRSVLYENQGIARFKDVTDQKLDIRLYGMSPAIGDFNGDGYPDLYITAVGQNRLYLNRRGERFEDVSEQYGLAKEGRSFSSCATFLDYDQDGDLDLFVCNYVDWSSELDKQVDFRLTGVGRAYGPPTDFPGTNSVLYRKDGDRYVNVTDEAGIEVFHEQTQQPIGKALAVAVYDINGDSGPDLMIANDTTRNFLFLNQLDGTFQELGVEYGFAFDSSGLATGAMGIDAIRFKNREAIGFAIGNFANEMSSFYVTDPNRLMFSDDAVVLGIGATTRKALTFGTFFADLDNDGRLDLLSVNGHIEPRISEVQASQQYRQKPQLFWNCGSECNRPFQPIDDSSSGLNELLVGRGAAYGDLDGDGDLDIVVTQSGGEARIYRNDSPAVNTGIRIHLKYKSLNLFGVGAVVRVITGESTTEQTVMRTRSYLTQVGAGLHFGLGSSKPPFHVAVIWPDQTEEYFRVQSNQKSVTLHYGEGDPDLD